jgi:hypothetical protein
VFQVPAPCGRVLARAQLQCLGGSISRSIRWRVRDAVIGFTFQIGLSGSKTCSVVISWNLLSCRLGTSSPAALSRSPALENSN